MQSGLDERGRGARDRGVTGAADGTSAADRARTYAARCGFGADIDWRDSGAEDAIAVHEDAEWRQRLARALEAGRLAGRGIGAQGHHLADLPRSLIPWEVILRALVTRAVTAALRPTWARPARRWIAFDSEARRRGLATPAFEPGVVRAVEVPRIAVGVDTSGSIDDARLALFAAQVAGIGRRTCADVHVFVFDDGVRSHTRMTGANWETQITRIDFARGGGTSFVEVLAAAKAIDPSVIVLLTDLDGPLGPRPARIPVIWAVPDETSLRPPPFGRVVSLAR